MRMRGHWLQRRTKIDNLRMQEIQNVCNGDTARDDRLRDALERLYEVRKSQQIFNAYWDSNKLLPAQQRAEMRLAVVTIEPFDEGEAETLIEVVAVSLAAPPVLPPGVENIVKSPRRPGAPADLARGRGEL